MFKRTIIAGAVFGMAAAAPPASAQTPCTDLATMIRTLQDRHGETHQATGLQGSVQLMEMWASEETGTWTILITKPDGKSCIVAAGKSWTPVDAPLAAMDSPT